MKNMIALWVAAVLAWVFFCALAEVSARSAILLDWETGRVLYEKNADERLPLASTTKVMTCLLALENASLDECVTASRNASGVPGTSIYLSEGETLTMEEMLYGLMLRSGNDTAVAIAEHIAGSVEAFAAMMNARAGEMHLNAYFTTPNGLDEGGNGASARALAEIAREAMKNEEFRKIVSTKKKTIPWVDHEYMRVLTNKNKLLTTYKGALGIKTGYTSKAGRCLAFAAERDGMTVVGAVLHAPNWFDDAAGIMDEAFKVYTVRMLIPARENVQTVAVADSLGESALLCAEKALCVPLKDDDTVETELEIFPLQAPVEAGAVCGRAWAVVNGERLAGVRLICENSVAKTDFVLLLRKAFLHWCIKSILN